MTSKHGPRQDDQQKHEEHALLHGHPDEGRTEPRRMEAPGPGDAEGSGVRPEVAEPQAGAPSQAEIEDRAALAATFPPSMFPAGRDRLVEEAQARFADNDLIARLQRLPDGPYATVGQLWAALNDRPVSGPRPSSDTEADTEADAAGGAG